MRKKIVIGATAGALTLTGLAVAVPALAAPAATAEAAATAADRIRDALSGLVSDGSITQEQADEVAGTLAESGLGGHGGHSGGHSGGGRMALSTAAEALGMSEAELRAALEPEGTTLADVAEDRGVATGTLVDALVQAAEERVAEAVEEGRITQEQADERLADVEERVTERIESTDLGRGGGQGPRGDGAFPRGPGGSTGSAEETPAD